MRRFWTNPKPKTSSARAWSRIRRSSRRSLEKLWIHGGAVVDDEGGVRRGKDDFLGEYVAQRRHKQEDLAKMARLSEGHGCRMLHLVRHFGDQADDGTTCGICDVCAPEACVGRKFREPNRTETAAIEKILAALADDDGQPMGRLHRETFGDALDRRSFEHIVAGMVRAGLVEVQTDSFQKGGEWIEFQRISLAEGARTDEDEEPTRFVTLDDEPTPKKKKAKQKQNGKKRLEGGLEGVLGLEGEAAEEGRLT